MSHSYYSCQKSNALQDLLVLQTYSSPWFHTCNPMLLKINSCINLYVPLMTKWQGSWNVFTIPRNQFLEERVLGLKSHGQNVPCWSKPTFKNGKNFYWFCTANISCSYHEILKEKKEFIITRLSIWNVDHIVLFGNNQGIGVESFEECMVFLNKNPQVGNVLFPDGWSSAELDNHYSKRAGGNATLPCLHEFCP